MWPCQFNPSSQYGQQESNRTGTVGESSVLVIYVPAQREESERSQETQKDEIRAVRITEISPNDYWYKAYVIATVVLMIIGGLGVFAAFRTLKAISNQNQRLKESVDAMNRQAEVMDKQTGILKRSVKAAEDNAIAAKKSADTTERTLQVINNGRLDAVIKRIDVAEVQSRYARSPIQSFALRSGDKINQGFDFDWPARVNPAEPIEVTIDLDYSDTFRCRQIRFGWNTYDVTDQPGWRQSFGPGFNHETEYNCDDRQNPN
jgi:hypothetical protein